MGIVDFDRCRLDITLRRLPHLKKAIRGDLTGGRIGDAETLGGAGPDLEVRDAPEATVINLRHHAEGPEGKVVALAVAQDRVHAEKMRQTHNFGNRDYASVVIEAFMPRPHTPGMAPGRPRKTPRPVTMLGVLIELSGMRQAELAKKLGTDQGNVSRWVSGQQLPQRKWHIPLFRIFHEYGIEEPAEIWAPVNPDRDDDDVELRLRWRKATPEQRSIILGTLRQFDRDPEPEPEPAKGPTRSKKPA